MPRLTTRWRFCCDLYPYYCFLLSRLVSWGDQWLHNTFLLDFSGGGVSPGLLGCAQLRPFLAFWRQDRLGFLYIPKQSPELSAVRYLPWSLFIWISDGCLMSILPPAESHPEKVLFSSSLIIAELTEAKNKSWVLPDSHVLIKSEQIRPDSKCFGGMVVGSSHWILASFWATI